MADRPELDRAPAPARQAERGRRADSGERHEVLEARSEVEAELDYRALLNGRPALAAQRRAAARIAGRPAGPRPVQRAAAPNRTGLPDGLKSGIEALSGISLDGVKVHYNSAKPARLDALAYAQGRDIHLAPGQETHLPHEAWHLVQQAQGRVRPTAQMKSGVAVNDDAGLEREADVMGAKAAAGAMGEAAIGLSGLAAFPGGDVVQRKPPQDPNVFTFEDRYGRVWSRDLENDRWCRPGKKPGDKIYWSDDEEDDAQQEEESDDEEVRDEQEDDDPYAYLYEDDDDVPDPIDTAATLTWKDFQKKHRLGKASRFLQQVDDTIPLKPKDAWPAKKGKIGYVANILTTPGNSVQKIIRNYEAGGISEKNYGSFAMVIGVNVYRSLDGTSIGKVQATAKTATEARFPCAVIPFVWDFDWDPSFKDAQESYLKMNRSDRATALAAEKGNLVQSVIPYGQLRERVTADDATRAYVAALADTHGAVYIHLGDDDAVSLPKFPLLDRYTETILGQKQLPSLVVGGYSFATAETGGDLSKDNPGDVLTEIASQLDTLFRAMLPAIDSDLVYPTEPNLAFLAAEGKTNYLEKMLKPGGQAQKRLEAEEKKARENENVPAQKGSYFATGLLYGRSANEGENLRDALKEVTKFPKKKGGFTLYDPSLALPTASKRFTLRDEDRVRHEPTASTYGFKRREAFEAKGKEGFMAQIVDDLLNIKQSHIGGLKKEILKIEKKEGGAIAADVLAAFKAIMLGEKPPKPTSKSSPLYLKLIEKHQDKILLLAKKAGAVAEKMLASMPKKDDVKEKQPDK